MVLIVLAIGYPFGVFLHRKKFILTIGYIGMLLTLWTILVARDYNAAIEVYQTYSFSEFIVNYVLILTGMFWGVVSSWGYDKLKERKP